MKTRINILLSSIFLLITLSIHGAETSHRNKKNFSIMDDLEEKFLEIERDAYLAFIREKRAQEKKDKGLEEKPELSTKTDLLSLHIEELVAREEKSRKEMETQCTTHMNTCQGKKTADRAKLKEVAKNRCKILTQELTTEPHLIQSMRDLERKEFQKLISAEKQNRPKQQSVSTQAKSKDYDPFEDYNPFQK
jgi:hypothetical protein